MDDNEKLKAHIVAYQKVLAEGEIPFVYGMLEKYVKRLKGTFSKKTAQRYTVGNVSSGYMDFTYFPFFDRFLRERKLRFGLVLNHREICFELWLMGQNNKIQQKYWALLKNSQWNSGRTTKPKYSELEVILNKSPDFSDLDRLSLEIVNHALDQADAIIKHIRDISPR